MYQIGGILVLLIVSCTGVREVRGCVEDDVGGQMALFQIG